MFRRKVFLNENYLLNEVDFCLFEFEGILKKVIKLLELWNDGKGEKINGS